MHFSHYIKFFAIFFILFSQVSRWVILLLGLYEIHYLGLRIYLGRQKFSSFLQSCPLASSTSEFGLTSFSLFPSSGSVTGSSLFSGILLFYSVMLLFFLPRKLRSDSLLVHSNRFYMRHAFRKCRCVLLQ